MKTKLIISIVVTLLMNSAFASTKIPKKELQRKIAGLECAFVAWPFQNTKIEKSEKLTLMEIDRAKVRAYYLSEITSPSIRVDLAKGLLDFLLSVEPNQDTRSFLEVTGAMADLNEKPHTLVKQDICDLASKVDLERPIQ